MSGAVDEALLSTTEAADLLGVKTATVYTYVSRGHLDPIRKPGDPGSWFQRSDVEQLARSDRRRRPLSAASVDVTDRGGAQRTSITSITGRRYRYRGADPKTLAQTHTYEQVAEFLWTGTLPDEASWPQAIALDHARPADTELPLDRLRVAIAELAVRDQLRFGKSPAATVVTGRNLVVDLMSALPVIGSPAADGGFAEQLWSRLSARRPSKEELDLLQQALILVADHGVAPSTLAVRMAAGYRADLYGAIGSGMTILAGGWYGRRAVSAERMLDDIERVGDAEIVVGELLRQGGVPCLGQPRYAGNDPRTDMILDLLEATTPEAPALAAVREVQRITAERHLPAPSVELALATMCRSLGFINGASEGVFAMSRVAGWIAHAIEVYDRPIAGPPHFEYVEPSHKENQ